MSEFNKSVTDAHDSLAESDELHLHSALRILYRAHLQAVECSADIWDFAVEIDQLLNVGLDHNDLRYLHRLELVQVGQRTLKIGSYAIGNRGCVVLTPKGVRFTRLQQRLAECCLPFSANGDNVKYQTNGIVVRIVPLWDEQRRELRYGEDVVKRFKQEAKNQELILAAFQEEAWPTRIYDPLPAVAEKDTKCRLQDTIKALNRQQRRLIRFRGDGTGEGILWDVLGA